ncbi:DUF805 domain-containing protein [Shinella daejeonensis]|uniref:DUF805 domain-containing protein n=1 Tax=Shinella daejeonensis TaxID=659017 RepID=UPI0020C7608A|nr:DUF805 domain-containing protein [Shinella daejeonensis]MCP8896390.1 DUF805 domain-containing protein [Shinella daejeonensis]
MATAEEARPGFGWFFFGWSGRIGRAPYALGWLFWLMLLSAALSRLAMLPQDHPSLLFWSTVFLAGAIVSTVSSLMLTVKRLHDLSLPAALVICLFIPVISIIALLAFMLLPGATGPNDYGPRANRPRSADRRDA